MKIYVTHSTSFDFKNELYKPLRESELNKLHEIILPHENTNSQFSSKEFMKACNLIFAEVSYPSTGQGIELGWANMVNVPIVCFYKKGMKYSGAIKAVCNDFLEYEDEKDLIKKITEFLNT